MLKFVYLILSGLFIGLSGVLNYIFNRLILGKFTTEQFALYSSLVGLAYLLQIIATSIQNAITKEIYKLNRAKEGQFIKHLYIQFLTLAFLFAILPIIILKIINHESNLDTKVVYVLSFYIFVVFTSYIPKGILFGKDKINFVNFITLIETIAKFIAVFYISQVWQAILAFCLPNFISAIFLSLYIFYKYVLNSPANTIKNKIKIQWKNYFIMFTTLFLLMVPFSIDILMTRGIVKEHYSVLTMYGKLIFFASSIIPSVLFAKWVQLNGTPEKNKLLYIGVFLIILIDIGAIILPLILPSLINQAIFANKIYFEYKLIFLYSLSIGLYSLSSLFINFIISSHKTIQILLLVLTIFIQVILFKIDASSILSVITNQLIVYGVLLAGSVYLTFKTDKINIH